MKAGDRDEACSLYGEMRNAYKILVGKPEGRLLEELGLGGEEY
jgi:hypothetical protein